MPEKFKIRCDNFNEDLVFTGEKIATGGNRSTYGDAQNRYNYYELYRSESGKYIFVDEYVTHWQGETGSRNGYILDSVDDLKLHIIERDGMRPEDDFLSEWEKEFLEEAGIDLVIEV